MSPSRGGSPSHQCLTAIIIAPVCLHAAMGSLSPHLGDYTGRLGVCVDVVGSPAKELAVVLCAPPSFLVLALQNWEN